MWTCEKENVKDDLSLYPVLFAVDRLELCSCY